MDSEALQGWILKFRENSKRICTSVETFFKWIYNGIPPWVAFHAFISGRLIALEKQPGFFPVRVGETRRHIVAKCVLRVTLPEYTSEFFRMTSFVPD